MLRMDDCIDSLGEVAYFTTLGAKSSYWQIPIREQETPKTAISASNGVYEYFRMPFDLQSALATFQRALDVVLQGYRGQTCFV